MFRRQPPTGDDSLYPSCWTGSGRGSRRAGHKVLITGPYRQCAIARIRFRELHLSTARPGGADVIKTHSRGNGPRSSEGRGDGEPRSRPNAYSRRGREPIGESTSS